MTSNLNVYIPNYIIAIIAITVFSVDAFTQTTAIPDSSFEQALIDINVDTNGLNGNILNSDAEGVLSLNIFSKNITSLEGIHAFTDLKYLYCYFNNIETIDISQNLELEVLDIENNSIQSLDISNNLNLKELYISNNQLNDLDISNNLQLELLSCNLNNLNELDVSNNMNLEVLWCYSNNLTVLNVANNVLLESLFCGNNNLQQLDISNTNFLESIACSENNLQSLSFSNCIDLRYLDVSNNNLNSIDISSNLDLRRLLCSNNNITELDLSYTNDLLLFYANGNFIEELDFTSNTEIKYVHVSDNLLTSIDMRNNQNAIVNDFRSLNNPSLTCLFVDNQDADFLSDWEVDALTTFVETENECNALSIEENEETINFEMYPNPTTNYLNINLIDEANVIIYNINGQSVFSKELNIGLNNFELPSIRSGLYMVKIFSENKTITRKLIVK